MKTNFSSDKINVLLRPFFNQNGGYRNFREYEIRSLSELVDKLVGYNLWGKFLAIYPFVGRTANSHSFNVKDINQYKITWAGTLTHNNFGVTSGGGWGDTNFPLVLLRNNLNNIHISAYNRTLLSQSTFDGRLIGVNSLNILTNYREAGAQELNFTTANGGIVGYVYSEYSNLGGYGYKQSQISAVTGRGLMVGTNCNKCYLNGEVFGEWQPLLPTQIHPQCPRRIVLFGNRYETSVTSAARVNLAFASIGYGFSETDIKNFSEAVETFQKAMYRSAL
jgi:hypothetical protein